MYIPDFKPSMNRFCQSFVSHSRKQPHRHMVNVKNNDEHHWNEHRNLSEPMIAHGWAEAVMQRLIWPLGRVSEETTAHEELQISENHSETNKQTD